MPRKKRELVSDGIYHVFNRGISRKPIQFGSVFHDLFFKHLERSSEKFSVEIHAYCLMENHYHLLLKTPEANLDKFMQHFASCLSKQVNEILGADGALFRSRYRSILVKSNRYYIVLAKYIHFNPVTAKIVARPEQYHLSSFRSYCGIEKSSFLIKKEMLSHFNDLDSFVEYHETNVPQKISDIFSKKQLPDSLA